MENIIDMFGIAILETDGYADAFDDGTQYFAINVLLEDLKQYNNNYFIIGYDGGLAIYTKDGESLFEGTLLDSQDFCNKLVSKISR